MIQGSGGAEARAGCALEIHETQQSQSKSTFSVHLQDPVGKYKSVTITDDCYLIFLSHFSVSSYVLLSALLIEHYKLKPQKSQSDKKEKEKNIYILSLNCFPYFLAVEHTHGFTYFYFYTQTSICH